MNLIEKVVIKDGVNSDTEVTINLYSGQVAEINALLQDPNIPLSRGIASYNINSGKPQFVFSAVGDNEMWIYLDGIGLKVGGITSNEPGPAGVNGFVPVIGKSAGSNIWFALNYKLSSFDASSSNRYLVLNALISAGESQRPFKVNAIFRQISGSWDFLKVIQEGEYEDVALSFRLIADDFSNVFFKITSTSNDIKCIFSSHKEQNITTGQMVDATSSWTTTEPSNINSTEILFAEIL
jgi:hypothetical protein